MKREPLFQHLIPMLFWKRRLHVLSTTLSAGNGATDAPSVLGTFTSAALSFHDMLCQIFCPGNSSSLITTDKPQSLDAKMTHEAIFQARCDCCVLVCIPKSVPSTIAEVLASTIGDALSTTFPGPNYCRLYLLCNHTITTRQHL